MAGISDADYLFDGEDEDLSYSELDTFPEFLLCRAEAIKSLLLDHNQITTLPRCVASFQNLISLDISNNNMTYISKEITQLSQLRTLTARNNLLDNSSLPKELHGLTSLQNLNLSGNSFTDFPMQVTHVSTLRTLQLGANHIERIPPEVLHLKRLEVFYLGGNRLEFLPYEMGYLSHLTSLVLCDNKLESLPDSLSRLRRLQSLSLHNNKLSTLPPAIVKLDLNELSLRNNPLIVRFVEDFKYQTPSLLELAGRAVKLAKVPYGREDLPQSLVEYLDNAHSCVNPKCKGVYFSSRVEHVKFVDFCGKYRLPLLEYLCHPNCRVAPSHVMTSDSETGDDDEMPMPVMEYKMKKVLLG